MDVYSIWLDLGVLRHRAILDLKFRTKTPIHIGSGMRGEALQRVLVLEGDKLVIPASTWKGIFRKTTEILAKSLTRKPQVFSDYEFKAIKAHIEEDKIKHRDVMDIIVNSLSKVVEEYGVEVLRRFLLDTVFTDREELERMVSVDVGGKRVTILETVEALDKLDFIVQLLCPICRLYGAPSLKGKLLFIDTIVPYGKYTSRFRAHVGIDRASETKSEHHLYSMELVSCSEVGLKIIVNNVKPGTSDAILLAATLNYILNEGVTLGRRRSIGLGVLELIEDDSRVYVNELENLDSEVLLETLANSKNAKGAMVMKLKSYIEYLEKGIGR